MALQAGMIDDEMFSVIVWSFLWAMLLCPLVFRYLLAGYVSKDSSVGTSTSQEALESAPDLEAGEVGEAQCAEKKATATSPPESEERCSAAAARSPRCIAEQPPQCIAEQQPPSESARVIVSV